MRVGFPVTLGRASGSKAAGCLVYIAATPFVALFLSIALILPATIALQGLGLPEEGAKSWVMLIYPLVGIWTLRWALRDYRRRAGLTVTLMRDRLVVESGPRMVEVPFAEVESIRLSPARLDLACTLIRRKGRPFRLDPDVAPFGLVRDALDESLVIDLVKRLDRRLAADGRVSVRDSPLRSSSAIVVGMLRCLTSAFVVANPLRLPLAIALFRHGVVVTKQGWIGFRGGFLMEDRGIHPLASGGDEPVRWESLERIRVDEVGLVLRSRDGCIFRLSALADDFWPTFRWINARLSRPASNEHRVP